MSKTLARSDFELAFPSFISNSLILVDIMIVFRVMGFLGRCILNIHGSHCKKSLRTYIWYNNSKLKLLLGFIPFSICMFAISIITSNINAFIYMPHELAQIGKVCNGIIKK